MTTYASNSRQVLSMKGTASVPSFSFQGSNKTGWYLSNTNEMSATINGTKYVTINSSGVILNATWGGTTIGPTAGGTGLISYSTGDILYASATNTLSKLSAGTNGYFLGLAGGVPTWLPVGTPGSVASFSAGTTGFTPNTPTIGSITLAGTLNTTNGGTGLTSFTSGGAIYATSTSALTTGTLPIASGGTNSTATPTAGAIAYGTGTAISYSAAGTTGQFLTSNGTGAPTWQSLGPSLSSITFGTTGLTPSTPSSGAITVAGTLVVANGGTGISTVPANGQIDIGNGTGFTRTTLTAGTGISITNGAGTITINSTNLGTASRSFAYFVGQL